MKNLLPAIFLLVFLPELFGGNAKTTVERVDPPFWFASMKHQELQLLVYGQNLNQCIVEVQFPGVQISNCQVSPQGDYAFIDLILSENLAAGKAVFEWKKGKKVLSRWEYEFKNRNISDGQKGLDASDVIYLLMPDRFANGDTLNDSMDGMLEKANRNNPDGRHGGDLKGIEENLDYFVNLGVTSIWLNPVLENNNPAYSYHGYAITDFYKVDARLGTNEQYVNLMEAAHKKGLKVVMDMVFNHASIHGKLFKNLPDSNWVNHHTEFTRSNFRASSICDPYSSEYDKTKMLTGWFDTHMADLNQKDKRLMQYLTQNSVWWVEYAGLDAIRMDTWPYPYKEAMAEWAGYVKEEYPGLTILAETWEQTIPTTAFWQESSPLQRGFKSGVNTVTDFPMFYAISNAFNEESGWTQGLSRLYYHMAQDFVYGDPSKIVAFADNHDVNRLAETYKGDLNKIKMALVFLLTTNRIPQIYYGTEIAMRGQEHKGHGYIRQDMPGGWIGDSADVFGNKNLDSMQTEMMQFASNLLQWRKNCTLIHSGKYMHFVPEDGVYVYFRYNESKAVMVALNHSKDEKTIDISRYKERLDSFSKRKSILENKTLENLSQIKVKAEAAIIIELEP